MQNKKQIQILLTFFLSFNLICAQRINTSTDSVPQRKITFLEKSIIPLSLIATGIFVNTSHGSLGKRSLQHNIQKDINFHTNMDDYLQFAPVGILYAADAFHVKALNSMRDQTKYFVFITVTNLAVVTSMKRITNIDRPDGSSNSFPSGHTANAFALAGILHHEFKDSSPILSYSGYAFATTTAAFRVLNNKHWVSDVLVGAGVGMLITDVFYQLNTFSSDRPKKQKSLKVIFVPSMSQDGLGFNGLISF